MEHLDMFSNQMELVPHLLGLPPLLPVQLLVLQFVRKVLL
jgi:hypothetical protein